MSVPWYGGAKEWASILQGGTEGASSALQGAAQYANTKQEAKEAKRRTLASLLQNAMKRNRSLRRTGQDYQDEMKDYQSQSLQHLARGFVDALRGSTGRG